MVQEDRLCGAEDGLAEWYVLFLPAGHQADLAVQELRSSSVGV